MSVSTIIVRADWDDDAGVWVASSTDIDGLALEAETVDALYEKVSSALADLIALNGPASNVEADASIHLVASRTGRIAALHH